MLPPLADSKKVLATGWRSEAEAWRALAEAWQAKLDGGDPCAAAGRQQALALPVADIQAQAMLGLHMPARPPSAPALATFAHGRSTPTENEMFSRDWQIDTAQHGAVRAEGG